MPAAVPLPGYPPALVAYDADDLLQAPGCAVCRHAGLASDRYLAWFALEGHADTTAITRLTASLGTCSRHTRLLMAQPGAAVRLTAVYRYLVTAARDRLTGRAAPLARCPMCEHHEGAAGRALDTLLEGFADPHVRRRYQESGGLCIPHFGVAAARAPRSTRTWLKDVITATLADRSAGIGWLAGEPDHDADARAALRRSLPARAVPGTFGCTACLAAARTERRALSLAAGPDSGHGELAPGQVLCASHLADAAALAADAGTLASLLAWQARCQLWMSSQRSVSAVTGARALAPWRRARHSRPAAADCDICHVHRAAAQNAIELTRRTLRAAPLAADQRAALCVRHLLALRAVDPQAGQATARDAIEAADALLATLDEAFRKSTWNSRHEARGQEATAWRQATAFVDGGVCFGSPPRQT
ncbi:MAG TPA: hypothetical protein VLX31_14325 [Streptosporangiaceae bacterium]|nr:hypothetical protein [Streptosporangiaceae bacterium]